jgi:solute carrier family 20 (sodium-dependent phosphate transporter)
MSDEDTAAVKALVEPYFWLVVVTVIMGFVYAFGIGANDVANSFASTVASKSLTLKQAIIVAGIFEFLGSYLLGASVTNTIRSKIFDLKLYEDEPELIMLGLTTSIMVAAFMLLTATYFSLPVSTTHTIVGCIMGFSIAAKGFDSINWTVGKQIFMSWFISPGVAAVLGFLFFGTLRMTVMRHEKAFLRAYYTFPLVLFIGIGIDLFYVIYKGFNNFKWSAELPLSTALPSAFGFGAFCGLLWLYPFGPIIMKRIERQREEREAASAEAAKQKELEEDAKLKREEAGDDEDGEKTGQELEVPEEAKKSMFQKFADSTYNQDLHDQSMHESKKAEEIWDNVEKFDEDAEHLFTYVQVFTACLNAFAHGANDVANAIAPISGVLVIYQEGTINSKSPVQKWVLAYGGIGIVLGCLMYGYKVMKALGYKVTAFSPSRGACAELSSSLFVVSASFAGIPVSSTQSITGAVLGVGLASGSSNVNWLFFGQVCVGWVVIFFVSVILSAGLFSFCAYSPSLN